MVCPAKLMLFLGETMKLITDDVLAKLRESAEYTLKKNSHALLTKTVPVDVRLAIELGMQVKPRGSRST